MKTDSAFLKQKISESGRSYSMLAGAIKAPVGSFKTWVNDSKFPIEKLRLLAKELGTTIEELQRNGVILARKRDAGCEVYGDILPTLKAIAASNLTSVSFAQFKYLLELRLRLKKDISPELVTELLKHI